MAWVALSGAGCRRRARGGVAVVSFFDLLDSSPAFVLVVLAVSGFLAVMLHSGPRVALQSLALIAFLGGVGVAVGWAVVAAYAWVAANPQMAIGIAVGFVVGFGSSLVFGLLVYLVAAGGAAGEGES